MIARQYGRIINIASVAGKEGNPQLASYSASKAAVISLTQSLAKSVSDEKNITINSISPAVLDTPLLKEMSAEIVEEMVAKVPLGRPGKTEEVAALVHYLASDDASFTTGQCYDISGGRVTY